MHEVIDILKTPQCKWELELLSWILLDTDTKLKSLDKNLGNLSFQEFLKQGENIFWNTKWCHPAIWQLQTTMQKDNWQIIEKSLFMLSRKAFDFFQSIFMTSVKVSYYKSHEETSTLSVQEEMRYVVKLLFLYTFSSIYLGSLLCLPCFLALAKVLPTFQGILEAPGPQKNWELSKPNSMPSTVMAKRPCNWSTKWQPRTWIFFLVLPKWFD